LLFFKGLSYGFWDLLIDLRPGTANLNSSESDLSRALSLASIALILLSFVVFESVFLSRVMDKDKGNEPPDPFELFELEHELDEDIWTFKHFDKTWTPLRALVALSAET